MSTFFKCFIDTVHVVWRDMIFFQQLDKWLSIQLTFSKSIQIVSPCHKCDEYINEFNETKIELTTTFPTKIYYDCKYHLSFHCLNM